MKSWQAAGIGLMIGIGATLGIGAIGRTSVPTGPYLQANRSEIINTAHLEYAHFSQVGPNPAWLITLRYEDGKQDMITYQDEAEARDAWSKLQGILGLEQVPAPPGSHFQTK